MFAARAAAEVRESTVFAATRAVVRRAMAGFGPTDPAHYNDDYLRERGSNDTDSADGSLTFNFSRIHKIATLAAGAHGMAGRSLLPERSAGEEPSMERIDEAWEIERRESLRKMSSCAVPPAAAAAASAGVWLAPAPAAPPPAPAPAPVPPRMARAATTIAGRAGAGARADARPRRRRAASTDPPHPRRRSRRRHTSTWRRRTRRRRCRCAAS